MKNVTRKLVFIAGLLLVASFAEAQTTVVYQSISIIGSATATGWVGDIPMHLVVASDVHNWTITLPLTAAPGGNEVKFRTTNDWTVNWGSNTFPSGTGMFNGLEIPIPSAGIYTVRFNDVTAAYSFTPGVLASKAGSAPALALTLRPNPAHEILTVAYDLLAAGPASLTVYNQLGQPVRNVAAVHPHAGGQTQVLSLQGLAAGLYVVQLQAGAQRQTARVVVE